MAQIYLLHLQISYRKLTFFTYPPEFHLSNDRNHDFMSIGISVYFNETITKNNKISSLEKQRQLFLLVCSLETYGRLFVEEAVSTQGSNEIYDEIVYASVPGMFNVAHVFQFIVDGFNNGAFSEHYPVKERHQTVFHVGFQCGDYVYTLAEKHFEQVCRCISLIAVKLAEEFLFEYFKDSHVAVVGITGGKSKS